ncbi:MAG: hypothetical protein ACK56I_05110, partial [bacterium]
IGCNIDDKPLALLQSVVGFDRATFVPEQQADADDDENNADDDAGEGFAETAEPRGTGGNLDGIGHGGVEVVETWGEQPVAARLITSALPICAPWPELSESAALWPRG